MKPTTQDWLNGLIGVVIFVGSLPATRVAVADFTPLFLTISESVLRDTFKCRAAAVIDKASGSSYRCCNSSPG